MTVTLAATRLALSRAGLVLLWAMVIAIPLYGPLMPALDGRLFPVTSKVQFVNVEAVPGGYVAQMSYTKLRDCQYLGASADIANSGESVTFHPYDGPLPGGTWATGPHLSRPWFIGADDLSDVRLRFLHRCHPLWITVTVAYP